MITTRTTILSICLLVALPGVAYAQTGEFALHRIQAVSQVIEASGDPVDIYYPEISQRQRGAWLDRFPVVVFLQGARVDKEYYSVLGQNIAKHGFIVMIPDHTSSILNDRFPEIVEVTQALEHARGEDASPASPLYGITDTSRLGLAGHSFGSAALLFSIGGACTFPFCDPASGFMMPPELMAAAAVAGSARGFAVDNTGIPTLVIYGSLDRSVPDDVALYESLVPPKARVEIDGANHFGQNDVSEPPRANVDRGEAEQTVPQAITAARFGRWVGLFFRAHIKYDWRAWRKIYNSTNAETGVTVEADSGTVGRWKPQTTRRPTRR